MGLQTIIDNASFITINKRKGVGQTISRSGHIKTSLQQPSLYRFTVGVDQGLTYSANRDLLQELDTLDRNTESNVDIGATNTGISYITAYQGDLSSSQQDEVLMAGGSGGNLYVATNGVSGNVSGYSYLFKKGDFIQPQGSTGTYRYPYQVTSDVAWSSSANITIPVHRPVLSQTGVSITSGGVRMGSEVRFHLIALVMPTYSVVPHDRIGFDSDFELMEVIT
jgi:hypothetical protein